MADVSPALAVTFPVRKSMEEAVMFSNFQRASGVAPVNASIALLLDPERDVGRRHERRSERRRDEFAETVRNKGRHPGADRRREGSLHEGASDQRGVERVLPQTAEQRFAQPDRRKTGHCAHPQREGRRQRECQQHAGDGRHSSRTASWPCR